MTGTGRTMMAISVAILNPALVKKKVPLSMQWPGNDFSYALAIGVHSKSVVNTAAE